MEILDTTRLTLRTIENSDFEEIHKKIFSNYNVVKNTFESQLFTFVQTKEFLENNANFNTRIGLSVIIEKDTNSIIGLAGLLKCNYLNEVDYEIGFILEEASWGKGFAKEIGIAQLNQIKKEFNRTRAIAAAAPDNISSCKALESLGFTLEKEIETSRGKRFIYVINFKKEN
jgi:[ribosomal protein S5]-alanine N-acetyltransferase